MGQSTFQPRETVPLTQDPEKGFVVKAGTLGFSVTVYTLFAILGLALLLARRFLGIFGSAELGGNNGTNSFMLRGSLWILLYN